MPPSHREWLRQFERPNKPAPAPPTTDTTAAVPPSNNAPLATVPGQTVIAPEPVVPVSDATPEASVEAPKEAEVPSVVEATPVAPAATEPVTEVSSDH